MKIAPFQIDSYIQKIANEKISGCVVFGPEASMVNYRFDLIAKKIAPDLSDPFLVSNLSKERLSGDKGILADEFFSLSMLGGRKLILVKDCDAAAGEALKIIFEDRDFAKKSENFILIQAGDLDKSSVLRKICEDSSSFAALACYEEDERAIKKFIQDELVKKQIKFNSQIIDIFLERFGKNRQIILTELEKILLFLNDEKTLTSEVVEGLTASESEVSTNEFVMSFAMQNFEVALLQAEKLFRNNFEPITLIRFLSNHMQKLYHARSDIDSAGVDFDEAVSKQRLFFKTEIDFKRQLRGASLSFLIKILYELEGLEVKIKSGSLPAKLVFTAFVQNLIKKQGA